MGPKQKDMCHSDIATQVQTAQKIQGRLVWKPVDKWNNQDAVMARSMKMCWAASFSYPVTSRRLWRAQIRAPGRTHGISSDQRVLTNIQDTSSLHDCLNCADCMVLYGLYGVFWLSGLYGCWNAPQKMEREQNWETQLRLWTYHFYNHNSGKNQVPMPVGLLCADCEKSLKTCFANRQDSWKIMWSHPMNASSTFNLAQLWNLLFVVPCSFFKSNHKNTNFKQFQTAI